MLTRPTGREESRGRHPGPGFPGMIDDVGGPIDYDDCGAGPTVVLVPGSCSTGATVIVVDRSTGVVDHAGNPGPG